MILNILNIKRFCGTELFKISVATWMLLEDEKPILSIDLYSDQPLQQCEDSKHGSNISWTIMIPLEHEDVLSLKKQSVFKVPNPEDDGYDDNNLFYYFEHNEVRDQEVEILDVDKNRFLIKATGVIEDVVYWKNPNAHLEIEVWCEKFDKNNPNHLV